MGNLTDYVGAPAFASKPYFLDADPVYLENITNFLPTEYAKNGVPREEYVWLKVAFWLFPSFCADLVLCYRILSFFFFILSFSHSQRNGCASSVCTLLHFCQNYFPPLLNIALTTACLLMCTRRVDDCFTTRCHRRQIRHLRRYCTHHRNYVPGVQAIAD